MRVLLGLIDFSDIVILCNKALLATTIWPKCFDMPLL